MTESGRRPESLEAAASQQWGEWVGSLRRWDVFGGLTYRDQLRPGDPYRLRGPRPLELVKRDVEYLTREFKRQTGRRVEATVAAIESHQNGWPHVHPLMGVEGFTDGDLRLLWGIWYEKHGAGKLSVPRSQDDVSRYAAKYLAKDIGRGDVVILPARATLQELGAAQRGLV